MKKLDNYLNYLFSDYPETEEIKDVKKEIKDNLTERVNDYKLEGFSETSAIEKTIDSIGDIDELVATYGIKTNLDQEQRELDNYCETLIEYDKLFRENNGKSAWFVALATAIILVSLAIMSLVYEIFTSPLASILLLVGVVIALPLYIITGFRSEKHDLDNIPFSNEQLAVFEKDSKVINLKKQLKENYNSNFNKYHITLITGICLCLVAVIEITIFIQLSPNRKGFALFIFFLILALAVFLIIFGGMKSSVSPVTKSVIQERSENSIAAVIMPLAVIAYLILGFLFNLWHPGWLVFPTAALMSGAIDNYHKGKFK